MHDPIELAAIERGAGTPVGLVHGGVFHSGPAWARSIGVLAEEGFRAIAVDRRGHGRSEAGDADRISVHLHADDLRLTLELRDATPAHLVGVSYGCLVCIEMALCWPERVLSMTLMEPPLMSWAEDEPDFKPWYDRFVETKKEAEKGRPLEEWVPDWLRLIDSGMAKDIDPQSPYWSIIERQAPLIFKEEAGWEYRPDRARISDLQVPALVINGDQSEPPMQFLGEQLGEMLPQGTHARILGGGHDAHAKKSIEFNALMLGFLAGHEPES